MNFNQIFSINKVYIINLKKDYHKKNLMIKKLRKHNIEASFIEAIDGKNKGIYDLYLKNKNNPKYNIILKNKFSFSYIKYLLGLDVLYRSEGAFGCLLSHIKCLEDAIKNKYNSICIFEDDIIFNKNFNNKILETKKYLPDNWDILYLGCMDRTFYKSKKLYYHANNNDVRGFFAVIIKKRVFLKLLNKMKTFIYSADISLRNLKVKKIIINPNLVISNINESTTSGDKIYKFFNLNKGKILYQLYILNWKLENYDIETYDYIEFSFIDNIKFLLVFIIQIFVNILTFLDNLSLF